MASILLRSRLDVLLEYYRKPQSHFKMAELLCIRAYFAIFVPVLPQVHLGESHTDDFLMFLD